MKKNLLRITFLLVALLLSLKALTALLGYQAVESFRETYGDKVSVSYGWISTSYDGAVVYQDVVLTPYRLKRPFRVAEIRFQYDGYLSLLSHFGNLKSLDSEGLQEIAFEHVKAPLEGRDLEQWLAAEYGDELLVPLGLYGCGPAKRVGNDELIKMGILELKSDFSVSFPAQNEGAGHDLAIDADLYELGRIQIGLSYDALPSDSGLELLPIDSLTLTYVDNGYFKRLANMCESVTQFSREEFSKNAALLWRANMLENGFQVSESLINAYYTYLSLGGRIELSVEPPKSLQAAELFVQYDTNLFDVVAGSLMINGAMVEEPLFQLSKKHFAPELLPQQAPVAESSPPEASEPVLVTIAIDEMDAMLGSWIRVTLLSGKVHEGLLKSSDEFHFELVPQSGEGLGQVSYSVQREEVSEIVVRQK